VAVDDEVLPLREERPDERRRDRKRSRRTLLVALGLLALIGAGLVGGYLFLRDAISPPSIGEAFDIPEDLRPQKEPVTGADGEVLVQEGTTFLLAGTDRRADGLTTGEGAEGPTWLPGAQRSDAILLAHLTGDGDRAYVVSIPRDSWVEIPGYGMNKVNAAFSFGGPSLYVQTIEQLTDTRIDHLAVVDWNGLIGLVDVLGGVTLTFSDETVARSRTWPAGTHQLNGEEVRDYVGERYRLPRGDFDRVERQQNVLRALGVQMIESGTLTDPAKALSVAREGTQLVSVDESLTIPRMVELALSARGLRPDNITYLTVPTTGTGFEGSQSVVYLDAAAQDGFWEAFRTDTLEDWLKSNNARVTPERVN
jgi:LCP family protein required for cell wall assembly